MALAWGEHGLVRVSVSLPPVSAPRDAVRSPPLDPPLSAPGHSWLYKQLAVMWNKALWKRKGKSSALISLFFSDVPSEMATPRLPTFAVKPKVNITPSLPTVCQYCVKGSASEWGGRAHRDLRESWQGVCASRQGDRARGWQTSVGSRIRKQDLAGAALGDSNNCCNQGIIYSIMQSPNTLDFFSHV